MLLKWNEKHLFGNRLVNATTSKCLLGYSTNSGILCTMNVNRPKHAHYFELKQPTQYRKNIGLPNRSSQTDLHNGCKAVTNGQRISLITNSAYVGQLL